jgi:hypothetical protein
MPVVNSMDPIVRRAKELIAHHGEEWTDTQTCRSCKTIEVEVPDHSPIYGTDIISVSIDSTDGSLMVVEDDTVIFRFDQDGRLINGDAQKALPFLARVLDSFELERKRSSADQ